MAAAAPRAALFAEATCSICRELYTDPVTLDCGHIFCLFCITKVKASEDLEKSCPECRQRFDMEKELKPNKRLANIVEMLKILEIAPGVADTEHLCQKHEKGMELFCDTDRELLCTVCRESQAHREHDARSVEEAEPEYRVKLQDWMQSLRNEKRYIMESKLEEEGKYNTLRNKLREEKQKILAEIEEQRKLLKDKEQIFYQRLEQMEKTITGVEEANFTSLSNQITSLNALIIDLEKKWKEPAVNLLKDVKSALDRCEGVKFQGPEKLKKYKVILTLDPDTAHPKLHLSEEGRRVTWTDTKQTLPDTPKRFSCWCVLGSEGFTTGRHYWEVQLLEESTSWTVGVAAESVERKGRITWSPEGGVWAVERGWNDQYWALTSPLTPLSPREKPLKLGVYLDYEGGRLSLYNADSMELLYTFPRAPFLHKLFPIFNFWGEAEMRLV
ncbi:E3 ubiquitin-protein ligase TRIM39-like [Lissotriton helveticus]